jgi:hypothetical protein
VREEYNWDVAVQQASGLQESRRRLAGEMLAAAATHSVICDELDALEGVRAERALTAAEEARCEVLRDRKHQLRRRHDIAERRLRALAGTRRHR